MVFLLKYSNLRIFLTQKNCPVITTVTIKKKNIGAGYFIITLSRQDTTEPQRLPACNTIPAIQYNLVAFALSWRSNKLLESRYEKSCESQILNWENHEQTKSINLHVSIIYLVMYKLYHILLQRKQKRPTANVPHLHEKGRETYKYNTNQPFSQHRTKISPSTPERPWCEHSQSRRQRSRWPTARPLGKAVGCRRRIMLSGRW